MEGNHHGPFCGFVVDMMDWLAADMGITYTMKENAQLKFGFINENGVGNGMIGELMNCVSANDNRQSIIHAQLPFFVSAGYYTQYINVSYVTAGTSLSPKNG